MKQSYWGFHLIVNAGGCDSDAIRSPKAIKQFVKKLVPAIDMIAYGQPQVVRFGPEGNVGYSLHQFIYTSNISAHFVEETNEMYLDIFSCKPFKPSDAMRVVKEVFKPETYETMYLKRRAPRS